MFSIISAFWDWIRTSGHIEKNVLLLGLDNAGKTTLLNSIYRLYNSEGTPGKAAPTVPTVGMNLCTANISSRFRVTFRDVGGQDRLRILWKKFFWNADAIVFILDSSDYSRLQDAVGEIKLIVNSAKDTWDENKVYPIIVLANKQDLPSAMHLTTLQDALLEDDIQVRDFQTEDIAIRGPITEDFALDIVKGTPFVDTLIPTSATEAIGLTSLIGRLCETWSIM